MKSWVGVVERAGLGRGVAVVVVVELVGWLRRVCWLATAIGACRAGVSTWYGGGR